MARKVLLIPMVERKEKWRTGRKERESERKQGKSPEALPQSTPVSMAFIFFSRHGLRGKIVSPRLTSWEVVNLEFHTGHSIPKSMLILRDTLLTPMGQVDIFPRE